MKKNYGFSLIELMVTIAILAIIGMIVVPSFGHLIERQHLNKSTQELVNIFGQARAKAVFERRDIQVILVKYSSTQIATDTELYWKPSGQSKLTTSTTTITYNLMGALKDTASEVTFTICSTDIGKSKTVRVSPMGSIQLAVVGTC